MVLKVRFGRIVAPEIQVAAGLPGELWGSSAATANVHANASVDGRCRESNARKEDTRNVVLVNLPNGMPS